jgi:hypothetical protein
LKRKNPKENKKSTTKQSNIPPSTTKAIIKNNNQLKNKRQHKALSPSAPSTELLN